MGGVENIVGVKAEIIVNGIKLPSPLLYAYVINRFNTLEKFWYEII